ncbi:MAG: YtxH domain-containing protein [Dehalococcoidales bacterium]|nr:YtxH domain-containing protein [Dehalococcoidales bacterium]
MNGTPGPGIGSFFSGMIVGIAIGGVVALLFAPQSGNKTREMVKDRWERVKEVFSVDNRPAKEERRQLREKAAARKDTQRAGVKIAARPRKRSICEDEGRSVIEVKEGM